MEKKFELTDKIKKVNGRTLYRIKALRDVGGACAGEYGGFVESELNLSHNGNSWIYDEACVYDNATVSGNAIICNYAEVYGRSYVFGDAKISEGAKVYGTARVYGDAEVHGYAEIGENAKIGGRAIINEYAFITGNAAVSDSTYINKNAYILTNDDYLVIKGFGSQNRTTTFFKCRDGQIYVNCGCFNGTIDEFENKVISTHKDTKYGKEYMLIIKAARIHFAPSTNNKSATWIEEKPF